MRVALISDIHGNRVALDAVLDAIARENVDRLICLGDVATIGPQPAEAVARLQQLDGDFVEGNHDTNVLNIAAMERRGDVQPLIAEITRWCRQQLSASQLEFLRGFEPTLTVELGQGATMLCFHGSPKSNTDIILATTPPGELDALLAGNRATIMAGGHTHIPMLRRHEATLVINPGSVGEPLDRIPFEGAPPILPWAEYAIVTASAGDIRVDLRRVPLDLRAIRQASLASSNPFNWANHWPDPDSV